jgi:hypothetical protein
VNDDDDDDDDEAPTPTREGERRGGGGVLVDAMVLVNAMVLVDGDRRQPPPPPQPDIPVAMGRQTTHTSRRHHSHMPRTTTHLGLEVLPYRLHHLPVVEHLGVTLDP